MATSIEKLARDLRDAPVVDVNGVAVGEVEPGVKAAVVKMPRSSFKMSQKMASKHGCCCRTRLREHEDDEDGVYLFAEN
jgi:hypothetical protein